MLVDEAHRTQEGDLGRKMREALPNAFLFGLTGTPINTRDRNTFYAFGADEDERGYMSRYAFEESIRDGATLPLHFEPRLLELHIDKEAIDEAFAELTGEPQRPRPGPRSPRRPRRWRCWSRRPSASQKICADIAEHFQDEGRAERLQGAGRHLRPGEPACSTSRRSTSTCRPEASRHRDDRQQRRGPSTRPYRRERDAEEKLLDRFRDPADPLKILIVTSKLLTGFDAPILQAMYLDKPLRDHTLLQAICRTNRPYGEAKTHGLIVDYLGVFDDVAKASSSTRRASRRSSPTSTS